MGDTLESIVHGREVYGPLQEHRGTSMTEA